MSKIIVDTIESTGTTVTVNDGLASGAINAGTNAITAGNTYPRYGEFYVMVVGVK